MNSETNVLQFGPCARYGRPGLPRKRAWGNFCALFLLVLACLYLATSPEGRTMPSHPQFKEALNEQILAFQNRTGMDTNAITEHLAKVTEKEVSVIRSYRS